MTIRIGRFSFEPGLVATLGAALLLALFVSLARWQVGRAEEKAARQAIFDARLGETPVVLTGSVPSAAPLLYRRVRARGRWLPGRQFFVDNRIAGARPGFHVIAPLELEGSQSAVLVNLGWIARDARYPSPPAVPPAEGPAEVTGLATRPPERFLELSDEAVSGNVWQNLSIERYARASGLALLPVVVIADDPPPGLAAVRVQPDAGVAKHHEYALTWAALALTTLGFWLAVSLRRMR